VHTVSHTVETLKELDFEVLEHPYRSCPFRLPPFKNTLRGSRFVTEEEVVHKWLHDQSKTFFSNDTSTLGELLEEVHRKTRRLCRKMI